MAQSCDVFFYKTIQQIDLDKLSKYLNNLVLGNKTNVDIPNESMGLVPNKDYLMNRYGKYGWSKGTLLNLAIGQGEILVTPMQVLNYINLISTKGKTLHLVIL